MRVSSNPSGPTHILSHRLAPPTIFTQAGDPPSITLLSVPASSSSFNMTTRLGTLILLLCAPLALLLALMPRAHGAGFFVASGPRACLVRSSPQPASDFARFMAVRGGMQVRGMGLVAAFGIYAASLVACDTNGASPIR